MSDPHKDRCQWILDRVKDLAGEHCDGFVFIAEMKDPEDGSMTPMAWDGGFNQALGLAARAHGRLLEQARLADADAAEDEDDDWKAGVE